MKKGKLLTLVAGLLAATALAGCNETSYVDGVAITFTNANGQRTQYTCKELFDSYQDSTSTASTDFSKVKEILIREYYANRKADLETLEKTAQNKVDGIKSQAQTNANNNGTLYATELETLLSSEGVDNIEELYQKKLYDAELDKFDTDYKSGSNLVAMRDGVDSDGHAFFPASDDFGVGNDGYIKTRMPYNVSHILIEASGASENDATSTPISEDECKNFGDIVLMMAGANTDDSKYGKDTAVERISFGNLAKTYSKDTSSAENYGNLGIMDTTTSFVQGFQYGVYAYDCIYNQADSQNPEKSTLLWSSDAKYFDKSGEEVSLDNAAKEDGPLSDIGVIPYGAAVALANDSVQKNFPTQTYKVNDGESIYMPRNVIWNKYFNSHRIAVIVPNRIAYDDVVENNFDKDVEATKGELYASGTTYHMKKEEDDWKGVKDNDYAALPGFSTDTTALLPNIKDSEGNKENVLTNEKGQIILAVRGDSGTKGIHFITIDRSPLSAYGDRVESEGEGASLKTKVVSNTKDYYEANKGTSDITNLQEYFTFENPTTSTDYPTYEDSEGDTVDKTTLISAGLDTTKSNYQENIKKLKDKVSSYNSNLDTYEVQYLAEATEAEFNTENAQVKKIVDNVYNYSTQKRAKSAEDDRKTIDDAWTKYAEFLVREDEARELNKNGSQKLISEAAALTYNTDAARDKTGSWGPGGACYQKA